MTKQITSLKKSIIPVLFLATGFCLSQNTLLDKVDYLIQVRQLDSALIVLDKIDISNQSNYENGQYHLGYGKIFRYRDQHDLSIEHLLNAERFFHNVDSLKQEAYAVYEIIDLGLQQGKDSGFDVMPYIIKFNNYAEKSKIPIDLARAKSKFASIAIQKDDWRNALAYYDSTINYLKRIKTIEGIVKAAFIETNIGTVYNENRTVPDSALFYLKKSAHIIKEYKQWGALSTNYNNQAQAYMNLCDYKTAIQYYEKADSIVVIDFPIKTAIIYEANKSEAYGKLGEFEKAFYHAETLEQLKDSINETQQNISISEIKEQYDNEKLRADNLEIIAIAIALGGGLLGVSIIGFLLFKNTKRKQRIAEQEREIEIQKTEKLLKDQELTTIDAMISGQEKERQRLAGDLHDSVGATLAAAKLQFSHLQQHKSDIGEMDELFSKTGGLLDQAYNEIRSMAHLKNSGVIAKNGLLPAIKKLAKNASGTNSLKVQVEDFGLDGRLENSLEIAIFRVIQELITNVIKHANASEASIAITQHEDSLSIIVEDNGKGFDTARIQKKEGMGLSSIERRIEHLEGTMEVDSTIGKGTSVLIDIPI